MYRHDRAKFVPSGLWCDLLPTEWLLRRMGQNLYMQTATWLVSRQLTEAAGPWNTRLLSDDDQEYFCRVLLASDGVHFVPGARVYYRSSGTGSLSYIGKSDRKMEAQLHSMQLHVGYLLSLENSARARSACVEYLQAWVGTFCPNRPDLAERVEKMAERLGGRL